MTTTRPRPFRRAIGLRSLGAALLLGAFAASPSLAVAPDPSSVADLAVAPGTAELGPGDGRDRGGDVHQADR